MKKQNKKQQAHSRANVAYARMKLFRTFAMVMGAFLLFIFIGSAVTTGSVSIDNLFTFAMGAGAFHATMAVIGDQDELSDKLAAPEQIAMRIWLLAYDQIDQTVSYPTANSDREIGTIPTKTGEYWHYWDTISTSPDENATATKGDIITEFQNNFTFIAAGNQEKALDFIEEYSGKGFIIVYSIGEDETKYLVGSKYKPMILQSSDRKGGGKDGRYITFTFQNKHWRQPLLYVGSIVRGAAATVDADATELVVSSADQYQLTDGSGAATLATVSGIGSADYGRVIELLAPAAASNAPDIDDNTVFILIDGTTWTANPGSKISFKIIDTATLLEVPGTRVQTAA